MSKRVVVLLLLCGAVAACVPPGARMQKVWADPTGKTTGEREAEREVAAAGVAQVKEVSAATQSAVVLTKQANEMCFRASFINYDAAHVAYREALELEPNNTFVLAARATCYTRQGLDVKYSGKGGEPTRDPKRLRESEKWFKRAAALVRQALKINDNYGTAHLILAEIYALDGRPEKALETLNRIEELSLIPKGRESGFYAWRAYTKHLLGQSPEADANAAEEFYDPVEFAEYVDRLLNPDDYKGMLPPNTPVAPLP